MLEEKKERKQELPKGFKSNQTSSVIREEEKTT